MEPTWSDPVTERIKERALLPPEDPKYLSRDDAKIAIKNYLGSKQPLTDAPVPNQPAPLGPVDRWSSMLSNIAPSAMGVYRDYVAQPLSAPLETLGNMGKLPIGLYNKVAPEGMRIPGQGESEAAVDQYGQRLSDRFGSLEKAERTLVEDPVGAVAEVGMLASGGKSVASAAKSGLKSGISAVAENAPKAVVKKADAWSDILYRKAVAPPNKQSLSEFNIKKGLKYGKENKIVPSMEALEQSRADASALGKKTAAAFDNGVESTVRYNVRESFDDLASFSAKHKNSPEHVAAAKAAMERFTNPTPALRKEMGISSKATSKEIAAAIQRGDVTITTKTAQQIKKDIYDKHGARPWNDPDTMPLKTEAEKAIASGLRKSVAKRHETLKGLLEEESALHAWQDTAAQKILRDARNPWLSLAKKVGIGGVAAGVGGALRGVPGVILGVGAELLTTPTAKARVSFILDDLAKRGVKADRLAVEKILAANSDKINIFDHKLPPEASAAEIAKAAAEQKKWRIEKGQSEALAAQVAEANRKAAEKLAREREPLRDKPTVETNRAAAEQAAWKTEKDASDAKTAASTAKTQEELAALAKEKEPLVVDRTLEGIPDGRQIVLEGRGPNGKSFSYKEDARTAYTEASSTVENLKNVSSDLYEGDSVSLLKVLNKYKVAPEVKTSITKRAKELMADGIDREGANVQAVTDALGEWQSTHESILSQLGIKNTPRKAPEGLAGRVRGEDFTAETGFGRQKISTDSGEVTIKGGRGAARTAALPTSDAYAAEVLKRAEAKTPGITKPTVAEAQQAYLMEGVDGPPLERVGQTPQGRMALDRANEARTDRGMAPKDREIMLRNQRMNEFYRTGDESVLTTEDLIEMARVKKKWGQTPKNSTEEFYNSIRNGGRP